MCVYVCVCVLVVCIYVCVICMFVCVCVLAWNSLSCRHLRCSHCVPLSFSEKLECETETFGLLLLSKTSASAFDTVTYVCMIYDVCMYVCTYVCMCLCVFMCVCVCLLSHYQSIPH